MPTISEIVGIFILCRKQKSSCHDTTAQKKQLPKDNCFEWAQRGMIPRPSDYESAALTD